jgi:hypothetical protein
MAIVLFTIILTVFFYQYELFPEPLQAITSWLKMPVTIASGIVNYTELNIPVYDSSISIIIINFIVSVIIVIIADKIYQWKKSKTK